MDGVLVIDKPAGPTSHDVVAVVRRALDEKRIGHTGTLDPLATGVLPLVVGRATRLARFLSGADKEYIAEVRLGAATSTFDAAERHEGAVLAAGPRRGRRGRGRASRRIPRDVLAVTPCVLRKEDRRDARASTRAKGQAARD